MERVETIQEHKSGNPKVEKKEITWIEFLSDIKPHSESEMYNYAIQLLNGNFLYSEDGYTYFLIGLNVRDNADL